MRYAPIILVLLLVACAPAQEDPQTNKSKPQNPLEGPTKTLEDGTRYIIHPDDLTSAGPPKDGIPSIDDPQFTTVFEADEWIRDDELVLVLEHKGVERVYPLQILVWHEIVNDVVAGDHILITYCPLCASGIAYNRTINGRPSEFGTTGELYNSNLVMYDRNTDTYWTQIAGRAIIGAHTGAALEPLGLQTVVWRDWKDEHPYSEVLSRETGYDREYGSDPYAGYYEDSNLFFPVENQDDKIHPKDIIYGVSINDSYAAYREEDLEAGVIEDVIAGVRVRAERDDLGAVTIIREDTGAILPYERTFWFSWYAFHPRTSAYGIEPTNRG